MTAALTLVACSAAGGAPSGQPSTPEDELACRAMVEALPQSVDGNPLVARSDSGASWGSPRIDLRCGVPLPAAYEQRSELAVVESVSWLTEPFDGGVVFTAVGRTPLVSVTVPDSYSPEVDPLVDLAETVVASTEVTSVAAVNE